MEREDLASGDAAEPAGCRGRSAPPGNAAACGGGASGTEGARRWLRRLGEGASGGCGDWGERLAVEK
jgi:hypothetical protein